MPRRSRVSHSLQVSRAGGIYFGLATVLAACPSFAATWQSRVNYGGNTVMDLYVPDAPDASPGVVVALHYCSGNSTSGRAWFQSLADQHGFIIIAPGAGGNCFDATPARSGERDAIAKMVQYVIMQHDADPKRVFAAGASSGACMTNALLAAYPEVFAGGSVLAGVPAGAWTGGNAYGWTTPAGRTAQQWGDIVRMANPGFSGPRPRVQLWHGQGDTTLNYNPNYPASVSQWSNALGVDDGDATKTDFKASQDTWARTAYKGDSGTVVLETNSAPNAPHDLSGRGLWTDVVRFFGLDNDAPPEGGAGGAGGMGGMGVAGSPAAGGAAAAGASTGGVAGSAGASPSAGAGGGTTAGSPGNAGGSPSAGGSVSSGGSVNGGAPTGGTSAGGRSGSPGGAPAASAGSPGTAGQPSTAAGAAGATSGSAGSPSTGGEPPSDDGGCSITRTPPQGPLGVLVGLTAAALGALLRRRRRRQS